MSQKLKDSPTRTPPADSAWKVVRGAAGSFQKSGGRELQIRGVHDADHSGVRMQHLSDTERKLASRGSPNRFSTPFRRWSKSSHLATTTTTTTTAPSWEIEEIEKNVRKFSRARFHSRRSPCLEDT